MCLPPRKWIMGNINKNIDDPIIRSQDMMKINKNKKLTFFMWHPLTSPQIISSPKTTVSGVGK